MYNKSSECHLFFQVAYVMTLYIYQSIMEYWNVWSSCTQHIVACKFCLRWEVVSPLPSHQLGDHLFTGVAIHSIYLQLSPIAGGHLHHLMNLAGRTVMKFRVKLLPAWHKKTTRETKRNKSSVNDIHRT